MDARFDEAVRIVAETQRCSTSWLQRKMTIGYNRAAKIVEMMERRGMVGPPNGARDREVADGDRVRDGRPALRAPEMAAEPSAQRFRP